MIWYAKKSASECYHFVNEERNVTLCGLPVALVVIDRSAVTESLHLTSKQPLDAALCRDCAHLTVKKQRDRNSVNSVE